MTKPGLSIAECLEILEDTRFTNQSCSDGFHALNELFKKKDCSVTPEEIIRILTALEKCIKKDFHSMPLALIAASSMLSNVKTITNMSVQDLAPSALEVLHLLNKVSIYKSEYLKCLSMQVFVAYPANVLSTIIKNHSSKVISMCEKLKPAVFSPVEKTTYLVVRELLKKLPPEDKKLFVETGLSIWFDDLIPLLLSSDKAHHQRDISSQKPCDAYVEYLEILENVTAALADIDYFSDPLWQNVILKNICDTEKYPAIINEQRINNKDTWYRIWTVLIKLLKNKITVSCDYGIPIQPLLAVVESGFKIESQKVNSFRCWDVLIDCLSSDVNSKSLPRYLKLLLLPLKVNNAKNGAVAYAKFCTWWRLLRKFETKMDQFTDDVVIAFVHFAFGKAESAKDCFWTGIGLKYENLHLVCLKALVQILGHDIVCNCCDDFPELNDRMVTNKSLAIHWEDWMNAMRKVIFVSEKIMLNNKTYEPIQVLCVWRAFAVSIAELPPNVVRHDMFNALLKVLSDRLQMTEFRSGSILRILFSLAISLTEDNNSIKSLITNDDKSLKTITSIMMDLRMRDVYKNYTTESMIRILKPYTDCVVESSNASWLIQYLRTVKNRDISAKSWSALANCITETKILDVSTDTLQEIIMYPVNTKWETLESSLLRVWVTLFSDYMNKFNDTEFESSLLKQLTKQANSKNKVFFDFTILTTTLRAMLNDGIDINTSPKALHKILDSIIDNYDLYEPALPLLVDTLVVMVNTVCSTKHKHSNVAEETMGCVKNTIKLFFSRIKSQQTEADNIFVMLSKLFESVGQMFEIPEYHLICCHFLEALTELTRPLNGNSPSLKFILSQILSLKKDHLVDPCMLKSEVDKCIETLTRQQDNTPSKNVKVFTSPTVKVIKKSKKKEASIVNTVVENGEEYVVVKSNWKFNPRKLTENQKEKFQRKREDIPALYQDLSQSQDEFKLKPWKTDSQDTVTSSSSKSSKLNQINQDVALNILQNIQSSDVVPNIIKNIISENDKNHVNDSTTTSSESEVKTIISSKVVNQSPVTTKSIKSPRMALKDRVYRNIRNLNEKSSPKNETTEVIPSDWQISNVAAETSPPVEQKNISHLNQSAPSPISADRPSRMKRKPKKFDDTEFFGLTKRRSSQSDSHINTQSKLTSDNSKRRRSKDDQTDTHCVYVNDVSIISRSSCAEKQSDDRHMNVNQPEKDAQVLDIDAKMHESTQDNTDIQYKTIIDVADTNDNEIDILVTENAQDKKDNADLDDEEHVAYKNKTTNDLKNSQNDLDCDESQKIQKCEHTQQDVKNEDSKHSQNMVDSQDIERTSITQDDQNVAPENEVTKDNLAAERNNENINSSKDTLKTPVRKTKEVTQKLIARKSITKKSRIEKELAIDMVEGHPYLKINSEKRLTRKKLLASENKIDRKSLSRKPSKMKTPSKTSPRESKKIKEKNQPVTNSTQSLSVTVEETQEKNTQNEDAPCSEDVIESSQDSSFTTISAKSTKLTPKRVSVVLNRYNETPADLDNTTTATQDLLQDSECQVLSLENKSVNQDSKDDIELPQNKTADVETKNNCDLTENMDTEPIPEEKMTDDVIILDDEDELPITVNSENSVGPATQELAEADTQPNNPLDFAEFESNCTSPEIENTAMNVTEAISPNKFSSEQASDTQDKQNKSQPTCTETDTDVSSPFKDDTQRKQDFLNNTSELSPIKVQSPDKDKTTPEKKDETSADYLVVKLSSPVNSNGEPYHSGSPEFFTEDKISPDKRDQSPPRVEVIASNDSPNSSLSLKRNRPQAMRPGGRAAHMLGLCIPDSKNTIKNLDKSAPEEPKKINTSTPARRNLRVLYNAVSDNSDNVDEEEQDNFLKLKKALPSVDSSPSVPILKRKIDLLEDNTASPAGKRKRVSFHDPPVSTTVSVQKYIEPLSKSPSSAHKRLERQLTRTYTKSPKRLDSAFKLDTVLSKAVESFKEPTDSFTNDTNTSLDITPAVEVVSTSELNDTHPICPDLVDCKDSIEKIALELSSPAMKELLIKELDGKFETVGDLAKLTELEVNRLCIKAPKVQVAKKVLTEYANNRVIAEVVNMPEVVVLDDQTAIATEMDEEMIESELTTATIDTQTDSVSNCDVSVQTRPGIIKLASTQTTAVSKEECSSQTIETGFKTTPEIITSCLSERPDFMQTVGETLTTENLIDMLARKSVDSNLKAILFKLLDHQSQKTPEDQRKGMESCLLKEVLYERFDNKELIAFCTGLLQMVHDKIT